MLPKKKRVTTAAFAEIMVKGSYAQSAHFTLRYVKADFSRFSFVASKKVANSAALRGKLRRRGYSALADVLLLPALSSLLLKSPIMALVFIKSGTETMTFSQYKEELAELLKKI